MVRLFLIAAHAVAVAAYRSQEDAKIASFPTDVWEATDACDCDCVADKAKARMGKYRSECGVTQDDMDGGALLRSGAQKLCDCNAVDLEDLEKDMDTYEDQSCEGPIFIPIKKFDPVYALCKKGSL